MHDSTMLRTRARVLLVALAFAAVSACDPNQVQQVTENDVARIQITPDSLLLPIGESAKLLAHALDETGALLSGVPMTWQAGDPGVASVDSAGNVTGNAVGTTQIGVRAASVTASVTVRVDVPPSIALDADSVGFTKGAGEADPAPATVNVTNDGAFPLEGLTVDTITYGAGASDWLMATLDQGQAPAVLTISPSAAAVTTAGTYTAEVQLSGRDAQNSPASVTATLVVTGGAASMVVANDGEDQTAGVGTAVAVAPSVVITDAFDNPVEGVTAEFTVTGGGGSVTGETAVSDANGVARVGSWTLGDATGPNMLEATVSGFTPVQFTATATAGAASRIEITAGDGQTAVAGEAVTVPPTVTVFDALDNGVEGIDVTFTVTSGGGSVTGSTVASDSDGISTVGSWTLGATAGANTLIATAAGLTDTLTFSATGIAGAAASIALSSGDAQTDTVGATLVIPYAVLVTDANANPVSGVNVTWAVTAGGGSIPGVSSTNASGIATATHTFGNSPGAQTVTATATGLTGSPVTFSSTATVGAPASMVADAGDSQTATVNTTVGIAPSVVVTDDEANPVAGATVTFAVTGGGGGITGESAVTDGTGTAQVGSWTLGQTAGANELTATLGGLTPVVFTATGTADAAANLELNDGDGQSAVAGNPVSTPPSVTVVDQFDNPVQGVTVDFAVTTGGGSLTAATPSSGADGIATVGSWTLGATAGANSLEATSAGLSDTITFSATGIGGAADSMYVVSGDAQTDTVGATLATPYTVRVVDTNENGVPGLPVTWTVTGGGGSVTGQTATDGSGFATATHVFGTTAGPQTMTAALGGVSGSPLTFTSTATPGAAFAASVNAGDGQSATVDTEVAVDPSVLVEDRFGNGVSGVNVAFAVTDGNSSITGGAQVTDASGVATVGSWQLQQTAGTNNNTLSATPTGLAAVNFTASGTPDVPAQLFIDAGDGQSAVAGSAVAAAPRVEVLDQFDNPTPGVTVTFSVAGGGGSLTGATPTTNASGLASVGSWTLGTTAGANSLDASVGGIGAPVTFNATGTVGAAANIALAGGNAQTDTIQATLSPYTVLVTDANANPVSGITVTWAVGGGGSITPSSVTNGSGIATATRVLGTSPGSNTATASVGGLSGSPVNFAATVTAGAATSMVVSQGNGQTGTVNTILPTDPRVLVRDRLLNPVSGRSVTFAVTLGGGSATGTAQVTNASGLATVTTWRLGTTAGTNNNRLTASSTGLSNVQFLASATAGAGVNIVRVSGNSQTQERGLTVTNDPTVRVTDAFGNNVSGVLITFNASGSGSQSPTFVSTNASGLASTNWTVETGGHTAQSGDGTFPNTLTVTSSAGNTSFSADAIYSFQTDVNPIWVAEGCTGCHGGTSGLTLSGSAASNWLALVNVTLTCDAGLSSSYRRVNNGGGNTNANTFSILMRMVDPGLSLPGGSTCDTPMPDASGISSARREIIRNWIRNGAPFN